MKTKISAYQLFASVIVFEHGTSALFFLASGAKQDAWIAIILFVFPAILLQVIYTSLWKKYPDDTLVTYMPKIFGKFLGTTISVVYIIYFLYIASRVLRDFTELLLIFTLPGTPATLVSLTLITVNAYGLYKGVENLARFAHVYFPILIFFFILVLFFLQTTPDGVKWSNLKPVLENGFMIILKEGWPLLTFPYGESILFSMIYPSVVEASKVRKAVIFATISEGILLTINTLMFLTVLGVDYASNSLFPLLDTFRIMKVGRAFDRLDVIIVITLIVAGFFKISFFIYGSMLGTCQLINLKETKNLAIPFALIVLISSRLIAFNYPQHIKIGLDYTIKSIHLPLIIILPIFALLTYYIKTLIKKA